MAKFWSPQNVLDKVGLEYNKEVISDLIFTPLLPFAKSSNNIDVVEFEFLQVIWRKTQHYAAYPLGKLCAEFRDISVC